MEGLLGHPFSFPGTKDWISLGNLPSGSQQAWAGLSSGLLPGAGIISIPILHEASIPGTCRAMGHTCLSSTAGVRGGRLSRSQTSRNVEAVEFTPHFLSEDKEAGESGCHRTGNAGGMEGTVSSRPG